MNDGVLPFTPAEISEIVRAHMHLVIERGHGKVNIEVNYNEGNLAVVVVNGRRFDRKREHDARQSRS